MRNSLRMLRQMKRKKYFCSHILLHTSLNFPISPCTSCTISSQFSNISFISRSTSCAELVIGFVESPRALTRSSQFFFSLCNSSDVNCFCSYYNVKMENASWAYHSRQKMKSPPPARQRCEFARQRQLIDKTQPLFGVYKLIRACPKSGSFRKSLKFCFYLKSSPYL